MTRENSTLMNPAMMTGNGPMEVAEVTEKAKAAEVREERAKAYQARREAALQAFMTDHPNLTREQAEKAMEEEGF
jgi:hypothetical protein